MKKLVIAPRISNLPLALALLLLNEIRKKMKVNNRKSNKNTSSTAGKRRVCFEVNADPGAHVAVAGTFNGWRPESHPLKEPEAGHFRRMVYLAPGDYEYKFVIDGDWTADPKCEDWKRNEFGSLNSVLKVEGS